MNNKPHEEGDRLRFHQSHTHYLLLGLLSSFTIFVIQLGSRPIVLFSGGLISAATLTAWVRAGTHQPTQEYVTDENLLHPDVFLGRINALAPPRELPSGQEYSSVHWHRAQAHSNAIHKAAVVIAQQEPALIPDLLDTLHTVLALVSQLVQALVTMQQVQTSQYQTLAEQQLKTSASQLEETRDRLQTVHDRLLVESLDRTSYQAITGINNQLQLLVTDNKNSLIPDT